MSGANADPTAVDRALEEVVTNPSALTVEQLTREVELLRKGATPDAWRALVEQLRRHPGAAVLFEDPCTRRAFERPRGYTPDPVLLDLICAASQSSCPTTSPHGRALFETMSGGPWGEAQRARVLRLAAAVDETALRATKPAIVAVGCGHLPEATHSQALRDGRIGRWYAIDGDEESLEVIRTRDGHGGLVLIRSSVRGLLSGRVAVPPADLIYCADLLDDLQDGLAASLVMLLFAALKPGGRLILGNFAADTAERGYMEAFMDWWANCRTEHDMLRLASLLSGAGRVSRDLSGRILYLEAHRT